MADSLHPMLPLKLKIIKSTEKMDSEIKNTVLKFLFSFNVFESEFFKEPKWDESQDKPQKDYKEVWERINDMQNICYENNFPIEKLKRFQSHFSSVYLDGKVHTFRFESLRQSEYNKNGFSDIQMNHIEDFLSKPLEKNKRFAVKNALVLSYKFRNNLFHGKKDIGELREYKEDFEEITEFLMALMNFFQEINADNF